MSKMAGVWREIRHSSISLSCKQVEIVFQSVFASMEVFSFSYKPMLSWDDFNLCRLLVLRRGQWGKQGWARRLEREKEAALKKRLVKLIKKRFALSATFSSWQSISWLKAYLLAISFFYFAQERGLAQQTIKSYFGKVSSISLHVCLG